MDDKGFLAVFGDTLSLCYIRSETDPLSSGSTPHDPLAEVDV